MLPGSPLPNHTTIRGHLDEIVRVHRAVVLGARPAALDPRNQMLRQLRQANQQHIAVAQPDAVVVMVGLAHLPKNFSVPIRFEHNAALPGLPADKAFRVLDRFAVVKKRAVICEIAGVAGRIGHLPTMDEVAVDIDQINLAAAALRREQSIARKHSLVIASAQPDAGTLGFDLFNRRHEFAPPIGRDFQLAIQSV